MNQTSLPPAIFLYGPTAIGKTELAVRLVERLPMEIVSVDSALVYRGMDIGTAKPGHEILARAPHRLLDRLDPAEAYSAARFREEALREMEEIRRGGQTPLLVGGTMLYFRTLEHGLAEMPPANPDLRAELVREAAEHGWESLHTRLAAVDPAAAARIHPHDPQRLQRALEVWMLTGRTLSDLHRDQAVVKLPWRVLRIALLPPSREWLHARISGRFAAMLDVGFLDEVRSLRARGDLDPQLPSMRAVGYRQAWDYLEGRCSFDEMTERAVTATRGLAKRQLTWLNAWPDALRFTAGACEPAEIATCIEQFIETDCR